MVEEVEEESLWLLNAPLIESMPCLNSAFPLSATPCWEPDLS